MTKKRFMEKLSVLFYPRIWSLLYPINKTWDKFLNDLLDSGNVKFKHNGPFSVKINGIPVWISNYPYAYGSTFFWDQGDKTLPSRSTIMKLKREVDTWIINSFMEGEN